MSSKKPKKKAPLEQIVRAWEMLKLQIENEKHPDFGYAVYNYITKEAAQWNVVNIAHRSFYETSTNKNDSTNPNRSLK